MKLKKLTNKEEATLREQIANGTAQQIHLSSYKDMFRPRGSMQKNSLGAYLLEKLENELESWTDPKYADNPPIEKLIEAMLSNMMTETITAWTKFAMSEQFQKAFEKSS